MEVHVPNPIESPKRIGRPRNKKSDKAILNAALQLVVEKGIQGASMEAIAELAGVGKPTLYRRWNSKEYLIIDVIRELNLRVAFKDSGNFRDDLIQFLKEEMQIKTSNPMWFQLFYRLIGEAQTHPQFMRVLYDQLFKEGIQHILVIIKQAQLRKEIRPDLDPIFIFTLLGGPPLLYQMFLSAIIPDQIPIENWSEMVVDAMLKGIQLNPALPSD